MNFAERSPHDIPSILISDGNVLRIIANCYVFCAENQTTLSNARRVIARLDNLYEEQRKHLSKWLRENSAEDNAFSVSNWSYLEQQLKADTLGELLVRSAALLRACDLHIENAINRGEAFGSGHKVSTARELGANEFLIAYLHNPICGPDSSLPRIEYDVSETIRKYHKYLEITPLAVKPFEIKPVSLPIRTRILLNKRLATRSFRIAAAPMNAEITPKLDFLPNFSEKGPKHFVFKAIETEHAQREHMKKVLDECITQNISLLVLPELRMPPFLRDFVKDALRAQRSEDLSDGKGLIMVVCGSWHQFEDGEYVNRSSVLNEKGDEIWTHDKLAEFNISTENVEKSSALQELGFDSRGGVETIRTGSRLEICDSPIGRIAVAICVGFFHLPIQNVLVKSGATLFLVPSMSPDVTPMQDRIKELART